MIFLFLGERVGEGERGSEEGKIESYLTVSANSFPSRVVRPSFVLPLPASSIISPLPLFFSRSAGRRVRRRCVPPCSGISPATIRTILVRMPGEDPRSSGRSFSSPRITSHLCSPPPAIDSPTPRTCTPPASIAERSASPFLRTALDPGPPAERRRKEKGGREEGSGNGTIPLTRLR